MSTLQIQEMLQQKRYGQRIGAIRSRTAQYADVDSSNTSSRASSRSDVSTRRRFEPDEPPRFVIDLSLPPEQRYLEVCAAFKKQIKGITPLFDELVGDYLPWFPVASVHQFARLMLRGVYDEEENRELKGISKATGVEMHLLVCFNILLDFLMGCSSGGALVRDDEGGTKMVHFRTLDWAMPSLRKIVVQLDFKTQQDGPIIASSITYAGFVGVLTGVREGFSLSLNFRPNRHYSGKIWSDVKYYHHLLMVMLGKRRSIASQLRCFLLPQKQNNPQDENDPWKYWTYSDTVSCVGGLAGEPLTTTACYLCFSNGDETTIIEKDRVTAVMRSSDEIITITNNDLSMEDDPDWYHHLQKTDPALLNMINEGTDRRKCAETNYHIFRQEAAASRAKTGHDFDLKIALSVDDITTLVQWYPTTNEMTHFACVMDPREGIVTWCRRWTRPTTKRWIKEHQGYQRSEYM